MLSEKGLQKGRFFEPFSVLMVCIGATIGKVGFTTVPVSSNQQINVLSPSNLYCYKFIFYAMLSSSFQQKVLSRGKSSQATLPIINKSKWENLEIPVPPLQAQQQIVQILDQALKKIDSAKANIEQNIKNAEELFQTKLNEVFSRKDEGWEEKKLGEVCLKTNNIKWSEQKVKEFEYVDLSSVSRELLEISKTTTINKNSAPSRAKKLVQEGDVIFGTTRPTLKRVAIITEEFECCIVSTGYCVLRPQQGFLKEWIFYFAQSEIFMCKMEKLQRGTSYPAVTDKDVKNVIINFPKIEGQKKIVANLIRLDNNLREIKDDYITKIQRLAELKKSLLEKAFKGELTKNEVEVLN